MKKFLAVVMTAVLAMSMMTACGSKQVNQKKQRHNSSKGQKQHRQKQSMHSEVTLVSDGVLTVGAEMGYAPLKHFRKMERHLKDLILILLQKLLRD